MNRQPAEIRKGRFARRAAFTLVEVMVAAFLIGLGLAAVAGLIFWMQTATDFSRGTAIATTLAESKMEEILSSDPRMLTSGSDVPVTLFNRSWTIGAVSGGENSESNVNVQVVWRGMSGLTRTAQLASIVLIPSPSTNSGLNFNWPRIP